MTDIWEMQLPDHLLDIQLSGDNAALHMLLLQPTDPPMIVRFSSSPCIYCLYIDSSSLEMGCFLLLFDHIFAIDNHLQDDLLHF